MPEYDYLYPKTFISISNIGKEKNRVFVAMPFESNHSQELWKIIRNVCELCDLKAIRADHSKNSNSIIADILKEIEKAEIVIADLTDLNPNVMYELGIAHVRLDTVLLIKNKDQKLPFDLASMRCLSFDLSEPDSKLRFSHTLISSLQAAKSTSTPTLVHSRIERTKMILEDITNLSLMSDSELENQTVYISSFLSPFGVNSKEKFSKENMEDYKLLTEERSKLITLAKRGCLVKCMICPPNQNRFPPAVNEIENTCDRISNLLSFMRSESKALLNIEWAISPFRQNNIYIFGNISCIEGYQRGIEQGYDLTLRQSSSEAIISHTALQKRLFEEVSAFTLQQFPLGKQNLNKRELLRLSTIKALEHSSNYCETFQ